MVNTHIIQPASLAGYSQRLTEINEVFPVLRETETGIEQLGNDGQQFLQETSIDLLFYFVNHYSIPAKPIEFLYIQMVGKKNWTDEKLKLKIVRRKYKENCNMLINLKKNE